MSDTGHWVHSGEVWHVVQRNDGGVVCYSENGSFTAADRETWNRWKQHFGWEQQSNADAET